MQIKTWCYDTNGNLLGAVPVVGQSNQWSRNFTYDAENRQVSATINGFAYSYTFDGLGQRVTKTNSNNITTVFAYDAFGNLAAEYTSQSSARACGTPTCYVSWDHLDSMRMLTDANGSSTVKRYDYLPFGGELLAGINGRTAGMGYYSTPDSTNPKFTGQMRDSETYDPNGGTANDWFIARTFSGAQGRFQSVDPGNAGADPSNPQSWNAYAYVGNNPLSYTDPSGMLQSSGGGGGGYGAVAGLIVAGFEALGDWIDSLFSSSSPPPPNWSNVKQVPVSDNGSCPSFGFCSQGSYPGLDSGNNIGFIPVFYAQGRGKSPKAKSPLCNDQNAVNFVKANIGAATQVSGLLQVPPVNILGLSAAESGYGKDPNVTTIVDGQPANNFFSLHGGASAPYANGSFMLGTARLSTFPSYQASAQSFAAQYGGLVQGMSTASDFASALVPRFNPGKAPLGNPNFVSNLATVIANVRARLVCY